MESYPELAKVHSKHSLQMIIERATPLPWASSVTGSEVAHRGP